MKNWKTTLCGVAIVLFQGAKTVPALAPFAFILDGLAAIATGAMGYFAKDAGN